MKVLIIGSGGFIGKNLLNHLASQGVEVCGVSSSDSNGINPHTGLLSEQFSIPCGTDTIIYLAQSPYYRQVPERAPHLFNVNVTSAIQVAELARQSQVKRFLYTSTGNVYASSFHPLPEDAPLNRDNWYALSKIQAEEALSLFRNDMEIIIARLFGIYGVGQTDKLVSKLINSVLTEKTIRIDKNPIDPTDLGGLRLSLTYIQDFLDIVTQILDLEKIPQYLNISGSETISIREIATLAGELLVSKPKLDYIEQPRHGNLIADNKKLLSLVDYQFTNFKQGLDKIINEQFCKTHDNS
ncbi:MAG: NAD(P)-dependent oxidoreductase [Symploca sp. SIO2E6]|nr:NAD(P)-dependent oxidoreductase [Symploca sp. SIO2E6]